MENKKRRSLFSPEELDTLSRKLLQRRQALWKEILEDLETNAIEEHQEVIDILREQGDMALEELRESKAFSLIEIKHNELRMIDEALQRIEKGEYGICVDCGKRIPPARLKALPYAVRCRECQTTYERL